MKRAKKKRAASSRLPVLLLLMLLFLAASEYSLSASQKQQAEPAIGQDQWEYYFTPFYEREEQEEAETSKPVWTMPPVPAI